MLVKLNNILGQNFWLCNLYTTFLLTWKLKNLHLTPLFQLFKLSWLMLSWLALLFAKRLKRLKKLRFLSPKRLRKLKIKKKLLKKTATKVSIHPVVKLPWGDVIHNKIKSLMHIKLTKKLKKTMYYEVLHHVNKFSDFKFRGLRKKLESNGSNFFFRIKHSIKYFRWTVLKYLNITFFSVKQINTFFFPFRKFSAFNYLLFTENNAMMFLIKIKISSSIGLSKWLLASSYIFSSKSNNLGIFSLIIPETVVQVIFSKTIIYFFRVFFFKIYTMYKFMRRAKWLINIKNKKNPFKKKLFFSNKYLFSFFYKMFFNRLLEIDYKTLTFIYLPVFNFQIILNYVSLIWCNHWNHKVATWKYLT